MSVAEITEQATTHTTATKPRQAEQSQTKRQPPHAVILYNDDYNTMEFVVETLQKVFGYSLQKAFLLMIEAHESGRALVWSGMKEHAEFKADQIRSRGADPVAKARGAQPLRVSIEPMPG